VTAYGNAVNPPCCCAVEVAGAQQISETDNLHCRCCSVTEVEQMRGFALQWDEALLVHKDLNANFF